MDIDFGALPEPEYSYLLGLYLGDGTISRHQKGVFRLRITWQERIVERHSKQFLRGLIHSDGCRVLNRVNGTDYPRYFFSQVSDDIRRLFCRTCRQLGIEYTWNNWTNVSIARRDSVAILDLFIGPKS